MLKVLIVEDEKSISDLIKINLTTAGYTCTCKYNGLDAIDELEGKKYDLILLDVMLPGCDGFEVMDYIRGSGTPVIFLTAKHDVRNRVRGLNLGADDYIVKPFEIIELLARVEAVLRRYNKAEKKIEVGGVVVDMEARQATKNGRVIELTTKEFGLLALFVKNKNIALYRETLYEKVWEESYVVDTRTVDLHVQRLRKKLGWENMLTTVYKVGYRLEVKE